jgi:small subunit ribosomal protein S6
MTHQYEVVYIFDSALEEAAITEKLERFHALIRHEGAEAPALDHWGKRTLAFPIKNRETGHYVIAKFDQQPVARSSSSLLHPRPDESPEANTEQS